MRTATMASTDSLFYSTANGLLAKMSVVSILQLTTEYMDAIEGDEEMVQRALDYLDGVGGIVAGDLDDAGRHIAFVVSEKLKWAEGMVNSFGGRRYEIPMLASDGAIPSELADMSLALCRYKLYSRRTSVPDDVINDYEQAMKWLVFLADGKVVVNLITSGGVAPSTSRSAYGTTDRTDVQFSTNVF